MNCRSCGQLEDGSVLDFAGSNFVSMDNFAYGSVARYLQLDRKKCCFPANLGAHVCESTYKHTEVGTATSWDSTLQLGTRHFQHKYYNLFTCNCYSFSSKLPEPACPRRRLVTAMCRKGVASSECAASNSQVSDQKSHGGKCPYITKRSSSTSIKPERLKNEDADVLPMASKEHGGGAPRDDGSDDNCGGGSWTIALLLFTSFWLVMLYLPPMDSLPGIREIDGSPPGVDDKPTTCSVELADVRGLEPALAPGATSLAFDLVVHVDNGHACELRHGGGDVVVSYAGVPSRAGARRACGWGQVHGRWQVNVTGWGWGSWRICLAS
ncbi:hypothetical protein ZWY2020_024620 [Hordeum vulgare]|nr:hypothetical protein ZWY2020_024620 [Hordeum vulgare]